MNQPLHTLAPIPSAPPDATIAQLPRLQTKRTRLERARALVIAQFGAGVLAALPHPPSQKAP
jgi:hypothetical protein